jgi:hypothetical protein
LCPLWCRRVCAATTAGTAAVPSYWNDAPGPAADDNGAGTGAARIRFQMTAGQTYSIGVDTKDGLVGKIVFNYAFRAPAANDNFDTPVDLPNAAGSISGSTIGATTQANEPWWENSTVWYTWTAPVNGEVRFTTSSTGDVVDFLHAYTGSALGSLTEVAYSATSNWWGAADSRLPVVAGTTYRISVGSYY